MTSKVDIARGIFKRLYGVESRAWIIYKMELHANLTRAGASTYYQKFKTEIEGSKSQRNNQAQSDRIKREKAEAKRKADEARARAEKTRFDYERFQQQFRQNFNGFRSGSSQQSKPEVKIEVPQEWFIVIGVDKNASNDEIKSAYRRKAKTSHPDHGGSLTEMQKLNGAYDLVKKLRSIK